MGVRCLLGHDFNEPELQREREEQGDEVIVTVREEKTCTRCGYSKTVSENKEITSIEQLAETAGGESPQATENKSAATANADDTAAAVGGGPTTTADGTGSERATNNKPTPEPTTAGADRSGEDAEILDNDETESESSEPAATPTDATQNPPAAEADDSEPQTANSDNKPQAADDDGIILSTPDKTADDGIEETVDDAANGTANDDTAESEAGAGEPSEWEWPEHETDPETTTHEWPERSGDDKGYDAETPPDKQPDEVNFSGGFTPEATADAVGDLGGIDSQADREAIEEPVGEELTTAGEALTKAGGASLYEPTVDDINTEFYCPECGVTRHAGESSMRAGDICPECQRGYIAEREV